MNTNGLYPNGGCCHICLKNDHLVKDCKLKPPDDRKEESRNDILLSVNSDILNQRDDYIEDLEVVNSEENNNDDSNANELKKPKKKSKKSK